MTAEHDQQITNYQNQLQALRDEQARQERAYNNQRRQIEDAIEGVRRDADSTGLRAKATALIDAKAIGSYTAQRPEWGGLRCVMAVQVVNKEWPPLTIEETGASPEDVREKLIAAVIAYWVGREVKEA